MTARSSSATTIRELQKTRLITHKSWEEYCMQGSHLEVTGRERLSSDLGFCLFWSWGWGALGFPGFTLWWWIENIQWQLGRRREKQGPSSSHLSFCGLGLRLMLKLSMCPDLRYQTGPPRGMPAIRECWLGFKVVADKPQHMIHWFNYMNKR